MQQARRILPLSYIEPSGGVVIPGGVLVYTGGKTARWNSIEDHVILDPSAAGVPSIPTLVETYNDLAWKLYKSGLVTTEPRVWFGAAGEGGVQLSVVGAPIVITPKYAPYAGRSGAYNYLSISDVLAELNGMLGNTPGAVFRYEGGRVSLIVKSGTTIQFDENPAAYGSTRRMLNRLFLQDISGYIGVPLIGPLLIQGQPITTSTYGVYQEPTPASNIQFINQTAYSFDVTWDASTTPGVAYYVHVNGIDKLLLTASTSITLGTNDGLNMWDKYIYNVVPTTLYEVSTSGNASNSRVITFGPISSGITRNDTITTGDIYETAGKQYGYRITLGSVWIGRKFNKILFPFMSGGGLLSSSFDNGGGAGISPQDSDLYINIYTNSPSNGGALIANSQIYVDGTATFNKSYTIQFINTVTIIENMHIIFSSYFGVICMGYDKSTPNIPTIPLEPIEIIYNTVGDTNIGMLCDFQLV